MALVIGHRTARALAAENSLEGIRAAKRCLADYVHVDVRLSRDGKLVLMHDDSVDRTTDGKGRTRYEIKARGKVFMLSAHRKA